LIRILQIGPLPPEVGGRIRGGVATHVWNLAKHFTKLGHRVGVLAHNYSPMKDQPDVKDGVAIYGTAWPLHFVQRQHLFNPAFWRKVCHTKRHFGPLQSWQGVVRGILTYQEAIHRFKPNIIHVHHLEMRFPFAFFSARGEIPLITTVHSTTSIQFSESPIKEYLIRLVQQNLKLAQHLIFVSQFVKEQYEVLFPNGVERVRNWIIHNPVDSSHFHPVPERESRRFIGKELGYPLILFVGNLIPRKGAHLLIEAGAKLKGRGLKVQLVIVGEGPQKDHLKKMIREKDLFSSVSLDGGRRPAELVYYYNAADLFVLPSLMESFGLVFIEAMLCGCPVIGTPAVLNELIPSSDYGYCTPPDDASALADVIEKALHRSWDRTKIRDYALSFDWNIKGHDFEEVYNEIARASS
jgi:glycosyltransferase involved in cell wall biosynthesis